MNESRVDAIARAVLYEGYVLYPYRPCVKTRQRWTFGGVFPRGYVAHAAAGDLDHMQNQCLVAAGGEARLSVRARFLHLMNRRVQAGPEFRDVPSLRAGACEYQAWQEAVEREVGIEDLPMEELVGGAVRQTFSFPASQTEQIIREEGKPIGRLVREQHPVSGRVEISAEGAPGDLVRLMVRVSNTTPVNEEIDRDRAMLQAFASTHLILHLDAGAFMSMTDPPATAATAAAACENIGCWPVLVGEPGQTDTLLASPIILPDYPQIAPESPGDLFDGCEIDEILTLRIMTLTDEEKRQATAVDPRVMALMERTQSLARDQLMNLHGTMRNVAPLSPEVRYGG
jgi:hydrogenase maturation protease